MLLTEHGTATCDRCGSPLWFGLKEENTGWKVVYVCDPPTGCGAEYRPGSVRMSEVASRDEAYRRAEQMWSNRTGDTG